MGENKLEKGCTFGLVLQQRVNNMENLMKDGFDRTEKGLKEIKLKNEQMFNHLSDRPSKSSARQVQILTAACSVLAGIVMTLVGMMIYGARL